MRNFQRRMVEILRGNRVYAYRQYAYTYRRMNGRGMILPGFGDCVAEGVGVAQGLEAAGEFLLWAFV